MKKITTAITLTKLNGSILIVKNAKAGKWTLPGGQIDKGEKYFQAAERETLEETGLIVKAKKNKNAKTKRYSKNKKQAVAYVGKVVGKKKVKLSHEHTDYKFLSPKKAIKKLIKRHRAVVVALLLT